MRRFDFEFFFLLIDERQAATATKQIQNTNARHEWLSSFRWSLVKILKNCVSNCRRGRFTFEGVVLTGMRLIVPEIAFCRIWNGISGIHMENVNKSDHRIEASRKRKNRLVD